MASTKSISEIDALVKKARLALTDFKAALQDCVNAGLSVTVLMDNNDPIDDYKNLRVDARMRF